MRITRVSVGGFGQFNGAHVEPAAGLTVIHGPNEAGKTTLLAFTRAMLFGFDSGRYPALSGGKRGGWLDVEMLDARAFRIERYGERGGGGSLRVLDGDGKDLGAGYLPTLLQGVESKVYRNIFAFGLEELTQFERLTDSEVAARIYGAGLGTGSVSGLDVENALRNERDALFRPGGQKPAINALLHALEEVDGQLRDRDLPGEYGQAGARLARVEEEVGDVNERHVELDAERRRQQRLIDGWTAWLERSRAMTEREALGDVRTFEASVLEQLGRLETTVADSARGADLATKARDLAQEQLESAEVDGLALDRRTELEALAEATKIEIAQQKERARTERELTEAQSRVDAAVTKLGAGWSVERMESFDDSIAVQAEITGRFRTLLEGSDQAMASARRDLSAATSSLEETTRQDEATAERVAGLETELGDRPPWATRDRALREIESLSERLASQRRIAADVPGGDLAATRAALEARTVEARELTAAMDSERAVRDVLAGATAMVEATAQRPWEPLLPPTMLAVGGLAVAIVLALADVSLLVAGAVAVAAVGGAVAWAYVLHGRGPSAAEDARARLQQQLDEATATVRRDGVALGLGEQPSSTDVDRLIVGLDEERRTLERDEDRQERAEAAAREVERLEDGLATAAAAVGLPSEPKPADLEAFGQQLASDRETDARRAGLLERVAELRSTVESQQKRRDELAVVLEQRTAESAQARAAWQDWLEQHDLDRTYDRETAARVVESVSSAKATVGALRTLEARDEALMADHAAYIEQVKALMPLLPQGQLDESDLAGATALLAKRLSDALKGERARGDLARMLEEREAALTHAQVAQATAAAAIEAFLADSGVEDAESLRAEVERAAQAATLDDQVAAATATLTALSGPGKALKEFLGDLAGVEDIDDVKGRIATIELEMTERAEERDGLNREAGGLRTTRAEMEADVDATELRQRQADLRSQLVAAADRWTVLALAHDMLARSRAVYEEAHRPAVVQVAERLFEEWTDGRYRRIIAPLGSPIAGVERKDGTQVEIAALSRGTSEQLYLALRFGLVEHFVDTSKEPLPIVMDDILVNFDDDRAARAARSIEELSHICQIIYFTCHPTTPLDAELEEDLRVLPVS